MVGAGVRRTGRPSGCAGNLRCKWVAPSTRWGCSAEQPAPYFGGLKPADYFFTLVARTERSACTVPMTSTLLPFDIEAQLGTKTVVLLVLMV